MSQLTDSQLNQYLEAIGFNGKAKTDLETLKKLQRLHLLCFPFGVIDVHLSSRQANKNPIPIDLPSIFSKLVLKRREGYCFEHNELFLAVLKAIGFKKCERHIGAVVFNLEKKPLPNHEVLIVSLKNVPYLVDVGFAPRGSIQPLALKANTITLDHLNREYRLIIDSDDDFVLQLKMNGHWASLYSFAIHKSASEQMLTSANERVSVSMKSPFASRLFITQNTEKGSRLLFNDKLVIKSNDTLTTQVIRTPMDFLSALKKHFSIKLPKDTRFDAKQVTFHYDTTLSKHRMLKRIDSSLNNQAPSSAVMKGTHLLRRHKTKQN